jgi:DNA polymerase-3 subunit gamma/tau
MTLLRLLAFEPATARETSGAVPPRTGAPISAVRQNPAPSESAPAGAPVNSALRDPVPAPAPVASTAAPIAEIADWPAFVAGIKLSGIALQLAAQTELKAIAGNELVLAVPEASRHLTEKAYADKLKAALDEAFGRRMRLRFDVGGAATASLAVVEKRERAEAQSKTEAAFRDDPFVQDVLARFDARIKPDSIKPVS